MIGGREFHRVGPTFLRTLAFMQVLLELRKISRDHFVNEEKVILYVFQLDHVVRVERIYIYKYNIYIYIYIYESWREQIVYI